MSPQTLIAATGCTPANATKYALFLTSAMDKWGISSPLRQAAFLGQVCIESGNLSVVSENLNYSAARLCAVWHARFPTLSSAQQYANRPDVLANFVYANRMGNGPPASGDGYKFRGRGLKQLTGRSNYAAYKIASGIDVLTNPDLLLQPEFACDSAAWFWFSNSCNALADARDWTELTHKINGGLTALPSRIAAINRALAVLAG